MRFILLMMTLVTITANAQNNPHASRNDKRIQQVMYQDNNVIPLFGIPFTTTQVIFSDEETVLDIEGGDTAGWMVTYHERVPNMVFIKPTILKSDTNLTVVTNKHSYYFHLTSSDTINPSANRIYAIQLTYPKMVNKVASAERFNPLLNPDCYNWDYRFSGSKELTPLHVFDDGTFTYFELTAHQGVPAIFAVDDNRGKESLVNSRRLGNYIVVQRIAPQFTLRSGRQVTSVFNRQEIKRIRKGQRHL